MPQRFIRACSALAVRWYAGKVNCFFFSSRRRHTICLSDWSSDVCSSDLNVSLIAGWFTLGLMVLPAIITASEESLKAVPRGFREGSLALGATKWQTIRTNVLPYALPGILTSSILGIARVAGETAPIMFTAAYVVRDKLPWQVEKFTDFFFQGVMALPYHIYVVSSKIPQNEYTERVQYGTALVFLLIVAAIATASIVLRSRLRNRYKW